MELQQQSESAEDVMEGTSFLNGQEITEKNGESDQDSNDSDAQETSTHAPNLRLDLSREQTPETADEGASTYTELVPGSPGSGDEETRKRRLSPSLDTGRATVKKTDIDRTAVNPEDPPLAVQEIHKKRVPGKVIEKQWEILDNESFKSFENLCGISMSSVLERFKDSSQKHNKESETQRVLTHHWLSSKLPKSFLARLKVTKLPPLKSLIVRKRGVKENNFDPLNIDQVKLRKAVFETYLLAELKQLESLEAYHSSLQGTYNLDLEYLNDFKKTTSNLRNQVAQERSKNEKELHLVPKNDKTPDIKIKPKLPSTSITTPTKARFDPDQDEDLKAVLSDIRTEISKLDPQKQEILDLCDQLDIIERQLYTRNAM